MKLDLCTTAIGVALVLSLNAFGDSRTTPPCKDFNGFSAQIERYPQEKLHLHTDKDSYIAGDTIWLRAHCADAATHRPIAASRYVYVELRDDRGSLVRRIKLLSRDSVYSGYLPTQSLERFGNYSLTAYTLYMRNQGPDYFFKKPLTIWPYQESRRAQRNTSVRKVSDFDVSFFPRRRLPDRRLRLLRGLQGTGRRRRVGRGHGRGEERPRRDSRHASHASRRHGLSALHGPHGRTLLRRMHDGGR